MAEKFCFQGKFTRTSRLSEQVANFLVSEIQKGVLRAGEKLPSEAILAEQFGVSRTVIREAFARLKQDGFLNSKQWAGAIVAEPGKQRPFRLEDLKQASSIEIAHLYELRIILEGDAAALAAERRNEKDLEKLRDRLVAMAHAVEKDSDGTSPDLDFHQIIAEASGNPYLRDLMWFLNDKLKDLIRRAREHSSQNPNLPLAVQEEHAAIFEAISSGDPVEARVKALAHLRNAANRLGLTVPSSV
jgi:DNA-binding FadR family transcriptional regulator